MTTRFPVVSALLFVAGAIAGCSGGGGGSNNAKPVPIILEPHEESSHLPGDIDFEGRASDKEDGNLTATALSWQILDADGDVVGGFQGATSTISLLVPGEYTAVLTAEDSNGRKKSVEHPFHIGNTIARISDPDNEDVLGIADPFDIDGRAETVAVGVFLAQLTFIGIDLASDDEVFRLPVTPPANVQVFQTQVTPSLPAGRFRIRLEVTTTSPAELAEDNIRVLADAAPQVSITAPASGSDLTTSASVQFSAIVSDEGGGTPTLVWESSVDGSLSTELEFTSSSLSRAKHRVTLTATDENGLRGRDSVEIYIQDPGTPLFVDVTGLADPDVRSLAARSATPDAIWVGTVNGISRVAADTAVTGASHTSAYNTNGNGAAQSAACIESGECLFGISSNAVSVRDAGDTAWTTFQTGLVSNVVNGIAQSAIDDHLFFATDAGITETDAARANPVTHDTGVLQGPVTAVDMDANGVVWAGTGDEGLVRLQLPSSQQAFNEDDGLADNFVHAVAVDGDGDVWVGTEAGLSRYDPVLDDFENFNDELPDERVLSLAIDGDIVWVGTQDGGARYDKTTGLWSYFDETDLAGRRVNAIVVDGQGGVWFGCGPGNGPAGGLTRYDGL